MHKRTMSLHGPPPRLNRHLQGRHRRLLVISNHLSFHYLLDMLLEAIISYVSRGSHLSLNKMQRAPAEPTSSGARDAPPTNL